MLRNRMQTRNYRFVWLCGASSSSQAVGVPHFNDGILGRFEFLRSSPAFFFNFAHDFCRLSPLASLPKKVGSQVMDEIHLFFDNEDTLVRWVWRHWKSYHKHSFFSSNKMCLSRHFLSALQTTKTVSFRKCKILILFNITGQPSNSVFLATNWFELLKWHTTKWNV